MLLRHYIPCWWSAFDLNEPINVLKNDPMALTLTSQLPPMCSHFHGSGEWTPPCGSEDLRD
jgi:hypothetical protein